MTTILLIEDDRAMLRGIKDNMESEGYHVITATDGKTGLDIATQSKPDLIVLDLMLPEVNGYEICRYLRSEKIDVPIIMLTAKTHESDVVLGLKLGADDYVTKPFSIKELLARCEALLRRHKNGEQDIYRFGNFSLDLKAHAFFRDKTEIKLSPKEFDLLKYFILREGRALSREEIMDTVWGHDSAVTLRSIDRFINALRQKIEEDAQNPKHLQTIREFGYKFCA